MNRLESKFSSCFQTTSNVSSEQQAESITYAHMMASFTSTTAALSSSLPWLLSLIGLLTVILIFAISESGGKVPGRTLLPFSRRRCVVPPVIRLRFC